MSTDPAAGLPPRDDNETTSTGGRRCPVCATPFTPIRRQAYCSNACRQIAWRRRQLHRPVIPVPAPRSRRDQTIYSCDECATRYLGCQWCPDCTRPCRRVGPGGECDCGELLTVEELLTGSRL